MLPGCRFVQTSSPFRLNELITGNCPNAANHTPRTKAIKLSFNPAVRAFIKFSDSCQKAHCYVQYLGTLESISSLQAVMPPLTLLRYLNPCCRRKFSAFKERTPALQCR